MEFLNKIKRNGKLACPMFSIKINPYLICATVTRKQMENGGLRHSAYLFCLRASRMVKKKLMPFSMHHQIKTHGTRFGTVMWPEICDKLCSTNKECKKPARSLSQGFNKEKKLTQRNTSTRSKCNNDHYVNPFIFCHNRSHTQKRQGN